ncbi:MAG: SMC family ATPase, partial [Chloroflexota bacterium]|nr:SMC family ATPase [Chloroflexota bacterium]
GNTFRAITGDSVTETQQKITGVLHMDYDTFTNSAFLRQGRADEFTIKSPVQRKQVLADILGLAFYDEMEAQAKELARQQENQTALLESAIQDINNELTQKPAAEVELVQAQGELARLEKVIAEHESRFNSLRQDKESLESQKRQLTDLQAHDASNKRELQRWQEQVEQHQSRIKDYETLMARRADIEAGYAKLIEARKLNEALDQKFRQSARLENQKLQLEGRIKEASQSLLIEHARIQTKISELETSASKLSQLKSELQQLNVQKQQLAEADETLCRQRESSQELRTKMNYLESTKTRLEQEIKELTNKRQLLANQTGASCPLCGSELGPDGLQHIAVNYEADIQRKSGELQSNRAAIVQLQTELTAQEKEIARIEARLKQDRGATQSKEGRLLKEISQAEEDSARLNEETHRLAEIEQRLAAREFARPEQEALRELEAELLRLDYQPQPHEEVRQRLTDLQPFEAPQRQMEEAGRLINPEKEALAKAQEAVKELSDSIEANRQKELALTAALTRLPQVSSDLARAETERQALAVEQKQSQEVLGRVKARLQHYAELETRRKEKEKLLGQVASEANIYKDLAQAFGKKGIQALLIETALPEIENEANQLLARMTDNRMHVKIETQRETKKGDQVETLDINIADELGTRNYEMFSGGEAFRINFAIRIALSRLLARRAGAPLPTLIIDEGFGTQDSAGIEKLKEAINSIQEDFQKILVITHVEELRDAFPTRIDVTKTAEGSTVSIG